MLRQERGHKLGRFKWEDPSMQSLKSTSVLSVDLLVISIQSKKKSKSSISLTPRSYMVGNPNPIKKGKQNHHCHRHHSITKTIIFEAPAPQSIVGGGKIIVSSKAFGFRFRFFFYHISVTKRVSDFLLILLNF